MQDMAGMQAMMSQMMAEEMDPENLKKQLMRHQKPIAHAISSLMAILEYQKSLIPAHLVEPLINSVKSHVVSELDKLK